MISSSLLAMESGKTIPAFGVSSGNASSALCNAIALSAAGTVDDENSLIMVQVLRHGGVQQTPVRRLP